MIVRCSPWNPLQLRIPDDPSQSERCPDDQPRHLPLSSEAMDRVSWTCMDMCGEEILHVMPSAAPGDLGDASVRATIRPSWRSPARWRSRPRLPDSAADADTPQHDDRARGGGRRIPMTSTARSWIKAGLPPGAYDALTDGLPASRLWSLLLDVVEARAAGRRPSDLVGQWDRDRFVQPAIVDQRSLLEVDRHLLAAAAAFDAIELSPVAPLGVCSIMGHASQNKVLSALRGTEVVSDPTNVLALECARRLRRDPQPRASCDLSSLRPCAGDSEAARIHGELPHLLPRLGRA